MIRLSALTVMFGLLVGGCAKETDNKSSDGTSGAGGSDADAESSGSSTERSPVGGSGGGSTEGAGGSPSGGVEASGSTEGTGGSPSGGEAGGGYMEGGGTFAGTAGMVGVSTAGVSGSPMIGGIRPPMVGTGGVGAGVPGQLPEDCSPMYRSSGPEYCSIDYECANGYLYTWCDTYDPNHWYCSCDSMGGTLEFELTNASIADACAYIGDLCMADSSTPIEFTDSPECTPSYQELGPNYCSMEEICTQSAEISEGVSVLSNQWRYTWCELSGGTWTCNCDAAGSSLTFDIPESTPAADVCSNALDICSAGAVELTGPRDCWPTYQSASPEWCDAQHECTRTGTIGVTEVEAHEWLYTSCFSEVEGQWTCDCGVGAQSMNFELSSPDAWSTCQDASASCVEAFASGQ